MTEEYNPVLNDIKAAIKTGFQRFYPSNEYGTLFYKNGNKDFLMCCVNHGISCVDGVFIKNICINGDFLFVNVFINEMEGQVSLKLENNI